MSNFVFVASYSLTGRYFPEEVNQSLAVLTKGLTPLLPGTVVIAALSWSPERTPPLNLEDVTGRDIVFALDKLKFENDGVCNRLVCNPDPSRNNQPSVPGIKITDFNNPFFERAFGTKHEIESMQPVQVFKREMHYQGHNRMFGCTIPFLLGLPWITCADNDIRWIIEKRKIDKPINLRYLNFQFDPEDERRVLERHEDYQAAPCYYGTFILVHLLGVKIYPYHISALCDYLDYCFESTTTPSKEGFLDSWRRWCHMHDGDSDDFISPYDIDDQEEIDFPNDGIDASARNLWGEFGERLIKDIEDCSAVILEDLWPVIFGDAMGLDDWASESTSSHGGGGASLTEYVEDVDLC